MLSTPSAKLTRQIPLSVNNELPAVELRFGPSDDQEIQFLCHLDSCAGMNTGSLLMHQWVMTKCPHIVVAYEECNDLNPFTPLKLDCAIPTADDITSLDGKLTAVVEYQTRYKLLCGKPATLKFGLGKDVQVNAIVGMPTWKAWGLILDLHNDRCHSAILNLWFPVLFGDAASGLPPSVKFSSSDFVRPSQPTTEGQLLHVKTGLPDTSERI